MGHATLEVPSGVAMDCAPSIAKECLQLQLLRWAFLLCAMLLIEGCSGSSSHATEPCFCGCEVAAALIEITALPPHIHCPSAM